MLRSGTLDGTQWPITLSLWLRPVRALYIGGGLGAYITTVHAPDSPEMPSTTTGDLGLHVGGGLRIPLIERLATLDVGVRYVRLGDQSGTRPANRYLGDHWTTSLGVAFGF
jgi:hypothetical protein